MLTDEKIKERWANFNAKYDAMKPKKRVKRVSKVLDCPLEEDEQKALVHRLDVNNYTFTATLNGLKLPKTQAYYCSSQGMRAGISDMVIILKNKTLLFLELKRSKKSLTKKGEEQIRWQGLINEIGNCQYEFGYGFEDCVEIIKRLENEV